jgi:eukaryotic-like serine/threonine-protein kinase
MLPIGQRFGAYEVLAPLGAGGMGEVYRAHDGKLGRDVALKVLPDAVAADPDRLARFEREAKLLAMLDHPGIASIHALEHVDRMPVLVLELVEGRTLAERLHEGPLSIAEALEVGHQVAEALESAHERGIVHRDLKPSNVKTTPAGKVKLLDFGLAKALDVEPTPELVSKNSTQTPATSPGAILGTAPYMSPEQARGHVVDKRTDVWSFGCVLYELLTGGRAFGGPTGSDTVAAILGREPDWSALPADVPASVRTLLRRCLEKDKAYRLHDMGDARIELGDALAMPSSDRGPRPRSTRRRAALGGGLIGAATAATWIMVAVSQRDLATPNRLSVAPPSGVALFGANVGLLHLAVSPGGDRVVFAGSSPQGAALFARALDEIDARLIPGTERAYNPFFSPDGRWLGFVQGGHLRKMLLDGGAPVDITPMPAGDAASGSTNARGASWGADGTIVYTPEVYAGLWQVSADGGTPRPITTLDRGRGETSHRWPHILPGGRTAIFTVGTRSLYARDARIEAVSLDTGERRVLVEGSGYARYSPTGHLMYGRLGSILAVPFDAEKLRVGGSAVAVVDDVQMMWGNHLYADFDVSRSGALAYVPGYPRPVERSLLRVDREGMARSLTPARRDYNKPRLSPDGRHLAVNVLGEYSKDLWRLDLDRDAWTRMTVDGNSWGSEWSPDGHSIAFLRDSNAEYEAMRIPADGRGQAALVGRVLRGRPGQLSGWSADGRLLLFHQQTEAGYWDVGVMPLDGGGTPRWLMVAPYSECCATLSPDGRWMAYASNETGRSEVYVRRFQADGERQAISTNGGFQPRWSRDGRELFYRHIGDRPKVMAVPVQIVGGAVRARAARPLFDDVFGNRVINIIPDYDVSPDGHFIFLEDPPTAPAPRQVVLIPEWSRELEGKMRAARR